MSYVDMAIVAAIALLLLFTLVAFGVGHKRWSIVSVVAAFFVALTIPTYLYFATQLLHHEWRWAQAARTLETRIARVRDAKEPSADKESGGVLVKVEGMASMEELRQTRDRWERALTRVDNWRGATLGEGQLHASACRWPKRSILLPVASAESAAGAAEPPADGDEPAAPVAETAAAPDGDIPAARRGCFPDRSGATVYVFDDTPHGVGRRGQVSRRIHRARRRHRGRSSGAFHSADGPPVTRTT